MSMWDDDNPDCWDLGFEEARDGGDGAEDWLIGRPEDEEEEL